jgi:hypothetical protein
MTSDVALLSVWDTSADDAAIICDLPEKTCRNMRQVGLDGWAGPGTDQGAAWRQTLAREGKLGAGSLADLLRDTSTIPDGAAR